MLNTGEMAAACLASSSRGVTPLSPHERAPLGTQLWCGATPHTRCAHAAASQPDHKQASNQAQAWLETPCEPARKKGIPDIGASVNPRSKKSCSRQGGARPQLVSVHTTAPQEGWGWIRNSPNKHSTERSGHSHPIRLRATQPS